MRNPPTFREREERFPPPLGALTTLKVTRRSQRDEGVSRRGPAAPDLPGKPSHPFTPAVLGGGPSCWASSLQRAGGLPPNLAICVTYIPATASLSQEQLRPGELGGPRATPVTFKPRSRLLAPQDPAPAPPRRPGAPRLTRPPASPGLRAPPRDDGGCERGELGSFPQCTAPGAGGRGRGGERGGATGPRPAGNYGVRKPSSTLDGGGRTLGSGRATAGFKSHLGLPEAGGGSRPASPPGQGAPWSVGGCAGIALQSEGSQLWEEGTALSCPQTDPQTAAST